MEARQAALEQADNVAHAGWSADLAGVDRSGIGTRAWPASSASIYASLWMAASSSSRSISSLRACASRTADARPSELACDRLQRAVDQHARRALLTGRAPAPISRVLISSTKRSTSARRRSVGQLRRWPPGPRSSLALGRRRLDVVRRRPNRARGRAMPRGGGGRGGCSLDDGVARDLEEPHPEAAVRRRPPAHGNAAARPARAKRPARSGPRPRACRGARRGRSCTPGQRTSDTAPRRRAGSRRAASTAERSTSRLTRTDRAVLPSPQHRGSLAVTP